MGSAMRLKMRNSPAPSRRAASRVLWGIAAEAKTRHRKMPKGLMMTGRSTDQ
jgi:hypothetical protein